MITRIALRDNIARVRESMAEAALRAGRAPEAVQLVAVSKGQPAEIVAEAAMLGLGRFGENRVQEAAAKIPRVHELVGHELEWHLVGTLQRNKVRPALSLFAILESVDSLRVAQAIAQRTAGRRVPVLLEVYFGADPARPGFRPATLTAELPQLLELRSLDIRGLMTVAPLGLDERGTRSVFAALRQMRDKLAAAHGIALPELSMGMTDDYRLAIAEGATIVRIGRAIFGERPSL